MISTIVLNWNRAYLLRRCVESYLATVGADYELIIVDNASSDDSCDYIASLEKNGGSIRALYLDANVGGEAFNLAIPLTSGELVHLSENDQLFLPGWREHAEAAFAAFDDLGQLSLFADTPTDDEVWGSKPSHLRLAPNGKLLYEAPQNVGTSSILRGALLRTELRIGTIAHGEFRFPDDLQLSADVKRAGFWCAWSDRYYVRNVGHERDEVTGPDAAYYDRNYAAKPWVGPAGWQARLERHAALPRGSRSSTALPDRAAGPENSPHVVGGKPARLWSMFDARTPETEVVDFLAALTRLIKPSHVVETGTWLGLVTCAVGGALVANGFGDLTTLEADPSAHRIACENLARYELTPVVDARLIASLAFAPDRHYDLAIFGSQIEQRIPEFRHLRPALSAGAVLVFPDAASHQPVFVAGLRGLIAEGALVGVDLPSPRGLFIARIP